MNTKIETLRERLKQLDALHASGALSAEAHAESRSRLERELVDVVMQGAPAPASRPSRRLQAGLAAGVVVLAAVGYSITGTPGRLGVGGEPPPVAAAGADGSPPVTEAQVAELVDRVVQRLKEKPDDAAGWALLARAYSSMGRLEEAVPAFQKALALAGNDANLLADFADTLAALNNGQISPEALQLVERALALEPDNTKALALAGSAAFDQRDYATAVRHWEKVERSLPADSGLLTPVRASIARARELGGLPPATAAATPPVKPAAAGPAAMAAAPAPASAASGAGPAALAAKGVSGSVTLAPALAAQASPGDTLFVLARAASGPRMPLAVLRKQVKDLPLNFTLDDSMAMAPNARISDHPLVVISVRISKSGDAMPQYGDLRGESAPVAPGTRGVAVQISEVLKR